MHLSTMHSITVSPYINLHPLPPKQLISLNFYSSILSANIIGHSNFVAKILLPSKFAAEIKLFKFNHFTACLGWALTLAMKKLEPEATKTTSNDYLAGNGLGYQNKN